MQDPLQTDRKNDVKFTRGYKPKEVRDIIRASGSPSLLAEEPYLRRAKFYGKDKFICEMIENKAFYAGTVAKTHFRLVGIAVSKEAQGRGYGTVMMKRIIAICRKRGLKTITLRTNRNETAANFYKKFGGKVVGVKENDYEMEVRVCFTSS